MENKINENEIEIEKNKLLGLTDSPLKSLKNQSTLLENSIKNEAIMPQIGHFYSVQRITDGQWLPAVVLEKREIKSKQIEYFVHFDNCNY
jgi:hypothetical protein